MALDPCARAILCGLSQPVLNALLGIIETQQAALEAQLAAVEASLAVVSLTTAPIAALEQALQATIDEIRAAGNLIPMDLIAGCSDVGQFMQSLDESLDTAATAVEEQLSDLANMLSLEDELSAVKEDIDNILGFFEEIKDEIAGCPLPAAS